MARRCSLTGKGVQSGNNVSYANNRTRRRFLPNIQSRRLFSEALGTAFRMRIATQTLRTIDKHGGLDGFLLNTADKALPSEMKRLKQRIETKRAAAAA